MNYNYAKGTTNHIHKSHAFAIHISANVFLFLYFCFFIRTLKLNKIYPDFTYLFTGILWLNCAVFKRSITATVIPQIFSRWKQSDKNVSCGKNLRRQSILGFYAQLILSSAEQLWESVRSFYIHMLIKSVVLLQRREEGFYTGFIEPLQASRKLEKQINANSSSYLSHTCSNYVNRPGKSIHD